MINCFSGLKLRLLISLFILSSSILLINSPGFTFMENFSLENSVAPEEKPDVFSHIYVTDMKFSRDVILNTTRMEYEKQNLNSQIDFFDKELKNKCNDFFDSSLSPISNNSNLYNIMMRDERPLFDTQNRTYTAIITDFSYKSPDSRKDMEDEKRENERENSSLDSLKDESLGQDPTKPLNRTEIKFRYQNLKDDLEAWWIMLRFDRNIILDNGWTISLRTEVPFTWNNAPTPDNPERDMDSGISDLFTQSLFIPPGKSEKFAWAFGLQAFFPTAGYDLRYGRDKYILSPVLIGVYYPEELTEGSFLGLVLRNEFSIAGNEDREDVNQLSVQPLFNYILSDTWFIQTAPEIRVNWEQDNSIFVPFDFTIGKYVGVSRLRHRDKIISLNVKAGLIKDYHFYDYELNLTGSWLF